MRVRRVRSGVMGGARCGAGGGGVRARSGTDGGGVEGVGVFGDSAAVESVGVGEASAASDEQSVASGDEDFKRPGIFWCYVRLLAMVAMGGCES